MPPNVHPRFEEFIKAASPSHQNADGCNLLIVYLRYSQIVVPEMIMQMAAYGVDPNQCDTVGQSCLHWACLKHCRYEIIFTILRIGVNPQTLDKYGRSAAHIAAENQQVSLETMELLVL